MSNSGNSSLKIEYRGKVWLSIRQLKDYLDLDTEDAARKKVARHKVKAYKFDGKLFVNKDELDRLIFASEIKGA